MGGQAESPFKMPLPHLGNSTRHLKLGEPITFNLSWGSRQECLEMDFGFFFAMSVLILSFKKSKPGT
jgi:hypothetical protein